MARAALPFVFYDHFEAIQRVVDKETKVMGPFINVRGPFDLSTWNVVPLMSARLVTTRLLQTVAITILARTNKYLIATISIVPSYNPAPAR